MAQALTIINRTSKTLDGTWDGKHYEFLPETKYIFPELMAEKFKAQNPLMGSEDPRTGFSEYLIGILEYNDPITPIEQSNFIERWDRKTLPAGQQNVDVVPGKTGLFSARDVAQALPLESNTRFGV